MEAGISFLKDPRWKEKVEATKNEQEINLEECKICPGCMRYKLIPLYIRSSDNTFIEIGELYCLNCKWQCNVEKHEESLPIPGREE